MKKKITKTQEKKYQRASKALMPLFEGLWRRSLGFVPDDRTRRTLVSSWLRGHKELGDIVPEGLKLPDTTVVSGEVELRGFIETAPEKVKEALREKPWMSPQIDINKGELNEPTLMHHTWCWFHESFDLWVKGTKSQEKFSTWLSLLGVSQSTTESRKWLDRFMLWNKELIAKENSAYEDTEIVELVEPEDIAEAYQNYTQETVSYVYPGVSGSCMKYDASTLNSDERIHPCLAYGGNHRGAVTLAVLRERKTKRTIARTLVVRINGSYSRIYMSGYNALQVMLSRAMLRKWLIDQGLKYSALVLENAVLNRVELEETNVIVLPYLDGIVTFVTPLGDCHYWVTNDCSQECEICQHEDVRYIIEGECSECGVPLSGDIIGRYDESYELLSIRCHSCEEEYQRKCICEQCNVTLDSPIPESSIDGLRLCYACRNKELRHYYCTNCNSRTDNRLEADENGEMICHSCQLLRHKLTEAVHQQLQPKYMEENNND